MEPSRFKRAKLEVIEIMDDIPPRKQETDLPSDCKEILLRDMSDGRGRLKTVQFDVSSFLTIRDLSIMRMVDRARTTLPLTSDDIDGFVCRCELRRVRRLRLEFYADELDGVMTLMTDNMDAFTSLVPSRQTPANLIGMLHSMGIVFFPNARHNAKRQSTATQHKSNWKSYRQFLISHNRCPIKNKYSKSVLLCT